MQIKSIVTFAALALATLASTSLAAPAPTDQAKLLSDNSSDGTLKQDPSLGATDDEPHKWWTWNPISAGDCHQEGGWLKIFPDGRLQWDAVTWNDHTWTGDIWHSTFQLKDGSNSILFSAGPYDTPAGCGPRLGAFSGTSIRITKLVYMTASRG
ncbi:hypothetical protein BG006_005261 [Podila minutissima]|uniref:Uncharacterized protein n=1 Tax=Podila minutissima TaxID=64525 RepID=A0A9P5SMP2_9FUNG|nr:hypothetical protein BG006_005261 [Podila minutissima]